MAYTTIDQDMRRTLHPQMPPPFFPDPPDNYGDDDHFGDDEGRRKRSLQNARLGLLMFLGAETMFFAGLLGAFVAFRLGREVWPPEGFPRLPVVITGFNTLILVYSAWTMWKAQQAMRHDIRARALGMLVLTAIFGGTFLAVQGYEWVHLVRFGLTLSSGVYGASFYMLIGVHATHVCGAVIWLLWVVLRAGRNYERSARGIGAPLCGLYWYYVVALWPILYGIVYFS